MQVDLLEIMSGMFQANGIQVLLFHTDQPVITSIDYGFRSKILKNYDYAQTMRQIERLITPGTIYQFQDDLSLNYALFCFPDSQTEEGKHYLIIGPVLFQSMNHAEFQKLITEKQIPRELETDVLEFYNRVPLVMSFDIWNNTIFYFLSQLCEMPLEYRLVQNGQLELFETSYRDYQITTASNVAQNVIEERYAYETDMINAVSAGNLEQALNAHSHFLQYKLLPRTPDPIRNKKNLIVILNTLLRKGVQAGSVHPLHIDNLSRQFAIQIEAASSQKQLDALPSIMIRKYCMLVKNYSRKAYSSLVQTCMNYTDFHYMEELSLAELAEICSVSNSYLSALFKKEVGMTLTDYINSTRIRQSLTLLNTTNFSIQEIASRCGFSDSNYYARTFKKFQGMSPKGYREYIRR